MTDCSGKTGRVPYDTTESWDTMSQHAEVGTRTAQQLQRPKLMWNRSTRDTGCSSIDVREHRSAAVQSKELVMRDCSCFRIVLDVVTKCAA